MSLSFPGIAQLHSKWAEFIGGRRVRGTRAYTALRSQGGLPHDFFPTLEKQRRSPDELRPAENGPAL